MYGNILKMYEEKKGMHLLCIPSESMTRNIRIKLQKRKFRLNFRKNFLISELSTQWNKLPCEKIFFSFARGLQTECGCSSIKDARRDPELRRGLMLLFINSIYIWPPICHVTHG